MHSTFGPTEEAQVGNWEEEGSQARGDTRIGEAEPWWRGDRAAAKAVDMSGRVSEWSVAVCVLFFSPTERVKKCTQI